MSVQPRDVVTPRAAHSMLDERTAAVIDNRSNNVPFGFPNERILDLDRLADHGAEELANPLQDQRVCGARRASADDLSRDGQIYADHAILEEANPRISE